MMSEVSASPSQYVLQYLLPAFASHRQLGWAHFSDLAILPPGRWSTSGCYSFPIRRLTKSACNDGAETGVYGLTGIPNHLRPLTLCIWRATAQRKPIMPQEAVQTAPQPELTSTQASIELTTSDIAMLAYQLWEERGRPEGSPEQDWLEAERQLKQQASASATA
jgi:hypothetical protein